jgi:hypothetical protein
MRAHRSGFTLLESLLSFGMIALVIGAAYLAIIETIARQSRLSEDLKKARFARAILTEYTITWPEMAMTGELPPYYRWSVAEAPLPIQEIKGFHLTSTIVTVTIRSTSGAPYQMSTAMIRAQ